MANFELYNKKKLQDDLSRTDNFASLADFNAAGGASSLGDGVYNIGGSLYTVVGGELNSNGYITLSSLNTAEQNTTIIQAALDSGAKTVKVSSTGNSLIGNLFIRSNTQLILDADLKAPVGRNAPIIRSYHYGYVAPSTSASRTSNIATILTNNSGFKVGDVLSISSGSDASFRGIVTVTAATNSSYSYASSGANGTVASGSFYNVIRLRRSLPGTAFSASGGYITVTDPGHNIRPGFDLYLVNTGGSTFAPGMVRVTKISADTWTYYISGASGIDTGTTYLSYDYDISITGSGSIDGNRLGLGSQPGGAALFSTTLFGATNNLEIGIPIGGSSIRGVNCFNCADVRLIDRWFAFDVLVGAQFEGGANGVLVDSKIKGDSIFHNTSSQQADDYIAFTGVLNVSGAVGNYDNMVSPYGLTSFKGIDVRSISMTNALNGVKLTSSAVCPFIGIINIGTIRGDLSDNSPLKHPVAGISIIDDGPGLVGTSIDTLRVTGALEWEGAIAAGTAEHIVINGTGTIKRLDASGLLGSANLTAVVSMLGATVHSMVISQSRFPSQTLDMPFKLTGGTIGELIINECSGTLRGELLYLAGVTIDTINIRNFSVCATTNNTGTLINYTNTSTIGKIIINGLRQSTESTNKLLRVMLNGKTALNTLKVFLSNIDITTATFFTVDATAATGSITVVCDKTVSWTNSGTFEFIRAGSYNWTVLFSDGFAIPVEKLFFFGYGISTLRVNGASSTAQINLNNATTYASAQMAPVNGDEAYNSTTGAITIGRKVRRAGAWTDI